MARYVEKAENIYWRFVSALTGMQYSSSLNVCGPR